MTLGMKEFDKLLEASEGKVHEGTGVTILQVVTRLMVMKPSTASPITVTTIL
jgi:hypothetical protein